MVLASGEEWALATVSEGHQMIVLVFMDYNQGGNRLREWG